MYIWNDELWKDILHYKAVILIGGEMIRKLNVVNKSEIRIIQIKDSKANSTR